MSALIGLGLRASKGGASAVGLAVERGEPRVLISTFIKTSADDDRLSLEPYGVAREMAATSQNDLEGAIKAVADGRKRQALLAAKGLQSLLRDLQVAGYKSVIAALLVNRAGWVTDLFEYSLAFPEHAAVAEGLAVREALRFAINQCGIDVAETDEKSLPKIAAQTFEKSPEEIDLRLKALGATVVKPWRKEQKMASLAAWVAVAGRR
jgi:hypothetical protein